MLGIDNRSSAFSKLGQQYPSCRNMLQHVSTGWPNARNTLRPTMLRYVELRCCFRLGGANALNLVGDLFVIWPIDCQIKRYN